MYTPPALTIELVPSTSWGDNLRSRLSTASWDLLRKAQYKEADFRCEICQGRGPAHPVECHEVWHYDDEKHIQTLVKLIALCPSCHGVKHIGFSIMKGKREEATRHLMKVNGWDRATADHYIKAAFNLYHQRSKHPWTLDLTWLSSKGISIS